MHVCEIMATNIAVVDRNDNLLMVQERMAAKHLRHLPVIERRASALTLERLRVRLGGPALPVVDHGELVGLVTQSDLFKANMSSAMGYGTKAQEAFLESVHVSEIMVYPVVTVTPETSVAEAATMMLHHEIGCLPVVEQGRLVGMITKTDLLRCLHTMSTEGTEAVSPERHGRAGSTLSHRTPLAGLPVLEGHVVSCSEGRLSRRGWRKPVTLPLPAASSLSG
jgi:CBS domain-containing protein